MEKQGRLCLRCHKRLIDKGELCDACKVGDLSKAKGGRIFYSDDPVYLDKLVGRLVSFKIALALEDLLELNLEGLNDYVDEVTKGGILTDITYSPVSITSDGCIVIRVIGTVEEI